MVSVRAVHTFVAEHGDELEFQAGELIEVIERDDGFGDGWWRGRNAKGEEGLFPATYISEERDDAADERVTQEATSTAPTAIPKSPKASSTPPSPTTVPERADSSHIVPPAVSVDLIGPNVTDRPLPSSSETMQTVEMEPQDVRQVPLNQSDDEEDLGIGSDARARLAAQAKLDNEQRDRQRISGGVTGLLYSDESDDDEEDDHLQSPVGAQGFNAMRLPSSSTNGSSYLHKTDQRAQNPELDPPLPLPATPPVARSHFASESSARDWTVDQVVVWAKEKGFDVDVCQKFLEHEITGDVLLELDANLLKELDIPQFGKRMRIAQAIGDLRQANLGSLPPAPIAVNLAPSTGSIPLMSPPSLTTPPASASAAAEGAPYAAWAHSRRSSSTTPTVPSMEAIKEGQANTPLTSSVPTTPVTPTSAATKRESSSSLGHRRGKASMDSKDRLSFFNRARKPAPTATSPGEAKTSRLSSNGRVHQMQPAVGHSRKPSNTAVGTAMALKQIGAPDHSGYMKKKGDRYGNWKTRFFVLKGSHLYYMKNEQDDRVKGHVDLRGYRVIVDENTNPGSYGFRLTGNDKPHFFSSGEQTAVREWMKALIKATIARDYTVPVTSSCNIPTIPLAEAQALAPRPPSPATRDATQRATRRENTSQLTAHDASVLMSLDTSKRASQTLTPSRPSRDNRRPSNAERSDVRAGDIAQQPMQTTRPSAEGPRERELLDWVNTYLPSAYAKASNIPGSFVSGEVLFLLVRSLSGVEPNPPVPPTAFQPENGTPGLSGLFAMMDIMIDAGVDTAGASINDIRNGDRESICRLIESVRSWYETQGGSR